MAEEGHLVARGLSMSMFAALAEPWRSGIVPVAMRPTVVLFDIDGTLLTCGGAGRGAMARAFEEVVGRADVARFPYGGMTDRAIARQGLLAAGLDASDSRIAALLARYLEHLAVLVASSEGYRVLAGVGALLDLLTPVSNVAVGLGTGNLVEGARIKLDRGSLWQRFSFGGFGSDAEDRAALLACGARRGAASLGVPLATARVVVLGDTPRDVHAARSIGAEVIAVATGGSSREVLEASVPDLVVDDLEDLRVRARLLR